MRSGSKAAGWIFLLGGSALAVHTLGASTPADSGFRAAMALVIGGIGAALLAFGGNGGALAAAICLLLSVPIGWQLPHELGKGNWPALVGLAFPVVGLWLAATSTLAALRERKYGARLEPEGASGTLGGRLTCRIVTKRPLPVGTPVMLTLSCVHSYASRGDRHGTRWQRVLWQDAGTATASGVEIPVAFAIPADVRASDSADPDDEVLWRLSAAAETSGLDFRARFTIPVARTAQTDPGLTVERLDAERQERAPRPSSATGGAEFYLPPGRNKTVATALTVFGALCVAAGAFFGYLIHQMLGWIGAALPLVVIGGLGLVLLLLASSLWFGSMRLELADRELRIRPGRMALARARTVRAGEAVRVELYPAMQQGERVWYDLRLHLKGGGHVTAGTGLERGEADSLAKEIRRELDLVDR